MNYACLPRPLIREILREIEIKYMIKKIKKLINNINKIIMNLIKVYSDRLGESRVDNLHKLQTGLCVISIILFIVFYSFFDVKFNNKAWFNYFLSFLKRIIPSIHDKLQLFENYVLIRFLCKDI